MYCSRRWHPSLSRPRGPGAASGALSGPGKSFGGLPRMYLHPESHGLPRTASLVSHYITKTVRGQSRKFRTAPTYFPGPVPSGDTAPPFGAVWAERGPGLGMGQPVTCKRRDVGWASEWLPLPGGECRPRRPNTRKAYCESYIALVPDTSGRSAPNCHRCTYLRRSESSACR